MSGAYANRVGAVLLAHTGARLEHVRALVTKFRIARWVFLGRNYRELRAWEDSLAARCTRIAVETELDRVAEELRCGFRACFAALTRRYASDAWFTSRVAEHNPMVSPLFRHTCYLELARRICAARRDPLLIVTDDSALLQAVASLARGSQREVTYAAARAGGWRDTAMRLRHAARDVLLFLRSRWFRGRIARRLFGSKGTIRPPDALLRTVVEQRHIVEDGGIRDTYLTGLREELARRGLHARIWPVLFNTDRPYHENWASLARRASDYFNPDVFLHFSDALRAVCLATCQLFLPRGRVTVGELDITRLVRAERLRTAFQPDVLEWLTYARLPLRLRQAGCQPERFIANWEHNITDRALFAAFARHLPQTRTIGYQHSSMPRHMLHLVPGPADEAAGAVPQRVVTNGPHSLGILRSEARVAARYVPGPALRYDYLHRICGASALQQTLFDILVALPLHRDGAFEILDSVRTAFADTPMLAVRIKPHPMMPDSALPLSGLPSHFCVTREAVMDLLPRAGVVVTAGSAVAVEAACLGVPPISVRSACGLDLSPLAGFTESICVTTPEELERAAVKCLQLSDEERATRRARGCALLSRLFNPINDEAWGAFLDRSLVTAVEPNAGAGGRLPAPRHAMAVHASTNLRL